MVSKWERGLKRPHRMYRELLCLLLEVSPMELGFAPPAELTAHREPLVDPAGPRDVPWATLLLSLGRPGQLLYGQLADDWNNDLLKRRDMLKSMGLAPFASALSQLAPPVAVAGRPRDELRPDGETLDDLRNLAGHYRRLYQEASPQTLMAPIRAHLKSVEDLLSRSNHERERRFLLTNHSQVAQMAGRLAFFDLHDALAARGYLTMAYDSAVAATDASLAANALGHLGFVAASAGRTAAAEDHLSHASQHAERGAPSIVRSWLAAVASEVHANAGECRRALLAIDDARRTADASSQMPPPMWFDFYDVTRLDGFEGYVHVRSGSAGAAVPVLESAIAGLDTSATKQRAVFLTDLASAHAAQGDVDRGCDLAIQATDALRNRPYATCVTRLRQFRSSLRRYETSRAVRELDRAMVDL
jgi:hypothetical protein